MVGPDELQAIARLARLHLSADEQRTLAEELTAVLAHMAALAAVPTNGVEPMVYGYVGGRDEIAAETAAGMATEEAFSATQALSGATAVRAGQFVVPNVIPERP